MKTINTKQVLLNLKGEDLKEADGQPALLGKYLCNVMAGRVSNPFLGWTLGKKFATEETVDLSAEEIVFIKEEVKRVSIPGGETVWMNAVAAGQILEILDKKD